jgi:non-ribosomal peptide synthetase component E (peptide arylation enzyme)
MAWTSPYEPVEVGGTTLPVLVAEQAARGPERLALIDGADGAEVAYGTLAARIEGIASGLAASDFGPGDVLAVWAPNIPHGSACRSARWPPGARSPG